MLTQPRPAVYPRATRSRHAAGETATMHPRSQTPHATYRRLWEIIITATVTAGVTVIVRSDQAPRYRQVQQPGRKNSHHRRSSKRMEPWDRRDLRRDWGAAAAWRWARSGRSARPAPSMRLVRMRIPGTGTSSSSLLFVLSMLKLMSRAGIPSVRGRGSLVMIGI